MSYLEDYYNDNHMLSKDIPFSELTDKQKERIENTLGYARFELGEHIKVLSDEFAKALRLEDIIKWMERQLRKLIKK